MVIKDKRIGREKVMYIFTFAFVLGFVMTPFSFVLFRFVILVVVRAGMKVSTHK